MMATLSDALLHKMEQMHNNWFWNFVPFFFLNLKQLNRMIIWLVTIFSPFNRDTHWTDGLEQDCDNSINSTLEL